MTMKIRTKFPMNDPLALANCLAAAESCKTTGNLWTAAKPEGFSFLSVRGGWEGQHPQWQAALDHIASLAQQGQLKIRNVVYSFGTMLAVQTVEPDHTGTWHLDAAMNHHSTFTSRAASSLRSALRIIRDDPKGFQKPTHPPMPAENPDREYGEAWLISRHLTHTQRAVLYTNLGQTTNSRTGDVLIRRGLIEPGNGHALTELGHAVRAWCNWWL